MEIVYGGKALCRVCQGLVMVVNGCAIWHVGKDNRKCKGSGKKI